MRSAWSRHPWLGTMGAIAGLILFMSVVPIVPFKPSCLAVPGSWNSERVVKGTMTSEYQEQLNAGLRALVSLSLAHRKLDSHSGASLV